VDTCFSAGALAIVTGLLSSMAAVASLLFRELLKAKESQIQELTRLARRGADVNRLAIENAERMS